ncbi:hypothetical protein AB3K78_09085 [Leucobacter sp. HNU]|uniref:hypothetical protein n=1 Tax=Leucobacter sp. HNU TaxID=3236805 RepID=UPI003A8037AE
MKIEVLANYAILFATLSFGASIAGAGIALGVPGNARVQRWSTIIPKGAQHSAFQNLLFIFAWSAMVQIGLVLVSFLAIAYGTGYSISPRGVEPIDALPHYSSAFFSFWIWWYALFELTAVVRTFMQVAGAIVKENVMKVDASPCSSTAQNDPVDGVCQSPEKPGLILPDGSKYHEVH